MQECEITFIILIQAFRATFQLRDAFRPGYIDFRASFKWGADPGIPFVYSLYTPLLMPVPPPWAQARPEECYHPGQTPTEESSRKRWNPGKNPRFFSWA